MNAATETLRADRTGADLGAGPQFAAATEIGAGKGPGSVDAGLIRLGGLAGFLCIAIFMLVNWVLKEFPPMDGASLSELQAYLSREQGTWATVHALRYVVFAIFPLYVTGLFLRIRSRGVPAANGWAIVGLVGAAMLGTSGLVTNTLETLAFFDDPLISGNPDLFWLLFWMTRFLFTAVILAWGMVILGFSVGGWRARALPRWIAGPGVVIGVLDIVHTVFLVSVMSGGWASAMSPVAGFPSIAWFGATGLFLMVRGST